MRPEMGSFDKLTEISVQFSTIQLCYKVQSEWIGSSVCSVCQYTLWNWKRGTLALLGILSFTATAASAVY